MTPGFAITRAPGLTLVITDELGGISGPKQKRLEQWPNLLVPPVLAKDIGSVRFSNKVVEANHSRCNGFSHSMEGECGMALVELAVWHRGVSMTVLLSPNITLLSRRGTPR